MEYRENFQSYLDAISKPGLPGGGSVISLLFCLGVSLVQMAVSFSEKAEKRDFLREVWEELEESKRVVFPYIDKDGEIFQASLREKEKRKKRRFIQELNKMIFDIGENCNKILLIAKKIKGEIKKSIISDFYIGMKIIEVVIEGCLLNLQANGYLFGLREEEKEARLNAYLEEFKKWLKF